MRVDHTHRQKENKTQAISLGTKIRKNDTGTEAEQEKGEDLFFQTISHLEPQQLCADLHGRIFILF